MTGLYLSHYAIEAELGRGGMGIVYRGKDTKLNRTVALKVLPASALASPDDRARFQREAQAAAAITHPNVGHIYQVDEATPLSPEGKAVEGQTEPRLFIAMEYIQGQTLHDYVKQGPVKLQEAVNIAGQIAEALKEAHAKDIVHRDIKSANIMLTDGGVAKVLDFGLAKTNQSTMLTRMGSTLGTVAYMSPEQARGQEVDGRSDLYSLGTVLYEMVAGRLPYAGDYEQAVIYGILNEAPEPLTAVRTGVPMQLEWIVNKLLAKESEYRYQSAAGLLADLKSLDLSGSGMTQRSMPAAAAAEPETQARAIPRNWWLALPLVALVAGAAGWFLKPIPPAPLQPVTQFELDFGESAARGGRRALAVSPDGRFVAHRVRTGVRIRTMEDPANPNLILPFGATSGARGLFFSPDSRWLGYEDTDADMLMRVAVTGGTPTPITSLPHAAIGTSWASDNTIYVGFGPFGMGRVPASGGEVEIIARPDSSEQFFGPQLLPDGQTVLYTAASLASDWDEGEIRLLNLRSGNSETIHRGGRDARYLPTGHIVYLWQGTLYAFPFDLKSLESRGGPAPIADLVEDSGRTTGAGHYDFSASGTLAYFRRGQTIRETQLIWMLPDGTTEPVSPDVRDWSDVSISPDGLQIAAELNNDGEESVWLLDTVRGSSRFLADGWDPVWNPRGDRVAYWRDNQGGIVSHSVDQSDQIDTLLTRFGIPQDWSPDGRSIAYIDGSRVGNDINILDVETRQSAPFLDTDADTESATFSPDGRWIAYASNESGTRDVYVRTFPRGDSLTRVSNNGGIRPAWSADGRTLYYAGFDNRLKASDFDSRTGEVSGARELPPPTGFIATAGFAVHPDGRLLLIVARDENLTGNDGERFLVRFIMNVFTRLQERAP